MNMPTWAGIALLAALALVSAVLGYAFRGDRNQVAISTAQGNEQVCQSALASNQARLADIQQQLTHQRELHDKLLAAADSALDARDDEIKTLREAADKRASNILESAHEVDCAALARMPVCPAVARELWPAAAQGAAADRHAH